MKIPPRLCARKSSKKLLMYIHMIQLFITQSAASIIFDYACFVIFVGHVVIAVRTIVHPLSKSKAGARGS